MVQIARKQRSFDKIPKNFNNVAAYVVSNKMQKECKERGPFILVQGPQPLSNFLHLLLLSKSNLRLIKILHYCYDCSNYWRNATVVESLVPLSLEDWNLSWGYPTPYFLAVSEAKK